MTAGTADPLWLERSSCFVLGPCLEAWSQCRPWSSRYSFVLPPKRKSRQWVLPIAFARRFAQHTVCVWWREPSPVPSQLGRSCFHHCHSRTADLLRYVHHDGFCVELFCTGQQNGVVTYIWNTAFSTPDILPFSLRESYRRICISSWLVGYLCQSVDSAGKNLSHSSFGRHDWHLVDSSLLSV